jgi:hypothetical protein
MTNNLVVVINRLKYQKLRKSYHMKWNFMYQLQLPPEPLTRGLQPPDPRSLCPLSSSEFVEPAERNSWVSHWVHEGAKSAALYPTIAMIWQCSENYAGRASLTLAVRDKAFRRKSSHLSACGKVFLCQPYTVVTTCVESGALFSVRVFCNYILKLCLLKKSCRKFRCLSRRPIPK